MATQERDIYNGNGEKLDIPKCETEMARLAAQCVDQVHRTMNQKLNAPVSLRDAARFFKIWSYIRWEQEERKKKICADSRQIDCERPSEISSSSHQQGAEQPSAEIDKDAR